MIPRSYCDVPAPRRGRARAPARRFVAIDFPDFNFRLMAALHRLGIPVVYYVSPQLWAWRPGRMETMKRFVDKVLVIFPFEAPLYERAGIPVQFVGHPLVDLARPTQPRAAFLAEQRPLTAMRPPWRCCRAAGRMRSNVLRRASWTAMPLIRARVPRVQFVVARAPNLPDALFAPFRGSMQALTAHRRRAHG